MTTSIPLQGFISKPDLGKRRELMERTGQNIQLSRLKKPNKTKDLLRGEYRIAYLISSQPRYDHFDTTPYTVLKDHKMDYISKLLFGQAHFLINLHDCIISSSRVSLLYAFPFRPSPERIYDPYSASSFRVQPPVSRVPPQRKRP